MRSKAILKTSRCQICKHPERMRIEMLRLAGMSLDSIAEKFALGSGGRDAVWRHCREHVSEDEKAMMLADVPLQEAAERAAAEGISLLDYLALIRSALLQQVRLAAATNDRHGLAAVSGKALLCLRQIGEITGQLKGFGPRTIHNTQINFMASPAFALVQAALIKALQPHPEAMAAVVAALQDLEASTPMPAPDTLTLPPEGYHAHAA
ncbi:hypothetical protein [Mesorhizobium sp. NZP2077]|uniref:hypothetical protein n=1 Tax=Mesorhizobium sp. NZP2077 TaxID=2483404 RepID=UPI00155182AB|nr:hypothetical protein [Mesorhizobium sp. NZP2077]QKC84388.1 hypothetical protein EB232_24840 [Mesorhizobium sp. NZP2077]QKD17949.1 hypothetical protein HGP13_24540 [Mesorhizobium sp. NZP2077]